MIFMMKLGDAMTDFFKSRIDEIEAQLQIKFTQEQHKILHRHFWEVLNDGEIKGRLDMKKHIMKKFLRFVED